MAHIKQNVLGVLKGKVGTLSTYSNGTGNVARIRTNATNVGEGASRTKKQQNNRVRWSNLVNFYKASKNWMPKGFETKKKSRSDYNQFMSINYANAKVALTKQEAAAGACVVEGYLISQGSLVPVQVQKHGTHWDTNIKLGTLALSADTTIAQFAEAVVANNNFIREGMQLSCVSYQQVVDDLGTPRVICTSYEMILDSKNTEEKAFAYLPEFCLASEDGVLCTSDEISIGGFAFVLSETISGRTMVSTQNLILNNAALIEQYTSADQIAEAIKSYGLSGNVFLDADYAESKSATPQPLYIEKVISNTGSVVTAGTSHVAVGNLIGAVASNTFKIAMSADVVPSEVSEGTVRFEDDGRPEMLNIVSVSSKEIEVKFDNASVDLGRVISNIKVTIAGTDYTIPFAE